VLSQQILNGLTLGGIYALIAVGYTMVYGIIQLINFAHGEVYMLGAFLALTALFLLSVACCALLGLTVDLVAYRPLRRAPRLSALITAIGVSIFLQNLARILWGARTKSFPDEVIPALFKATFSVGGVSITALQVFILTVALALMLALRWIVLRTKMGRAMRACAQDMTCAQLMGVDVNRVVSFTFALGSALGAVAGILIGVYYNAVYPMMGYRAGIKAFAAAVLGGIGNIPGAIAGAFILGAAESLGAAYVSSLYRDGIAYAIMILFILFKPTGVFGQRKETKV
jgi:branched-chain amino acid transport system permease protein